MKKLICLQGVAALASPESVVAYDSLKADASDSSGYGCHECIRNGWVFATTLDWYSVIENGSDNYQGFCCETFGADCLDAYDADAAAVADGYKLSSQFTSRDLALAACPMKESICGPDKMFSYTSSSQAGDTINLLGTWTKQDSCTWLFKAECDAPGFFIDASSTKDDSKFILHYLEYDTHDSIGITLNDDNEFPIDST